MSGAYLGAANYYQEILQPKCASSSLIIYLKAILCFSHKSVQYQSCKKAIRTRSSAG